MDIRCRYFKVVLGYVFVVEGLVTRFLCYCGVCLIAGNASVADI